MFEIAAASAADNHPLPSDSEAHTRAEVRQISLASVKKCMALLERPRRPSASRAELIALRGLVCVQM